MNVQIAVTLPPEQYRAVAEIAGLRGVQAHVLIEQLVGRALQPAQDRSDLQAFKQSLRRLHGGGRNDRQIAEALGVSRTLVSYHRTQMMLPANDKRGRKKTTPNQIVSTTV